MPYKLGPLQIVQPFNNRHLGTVIFLHGCGDTGLGLLEWVNSILGNVSMPHIKFLFPTAPFQPYTPYNEECTAWFNRRKISPDCPEKTKSILKIGDKLKHIFNNEVNSGIPLNKIIVGGFSMGGCMALHVGYHLMPGLAGVFALSAFLNENSSVYNALKNLNSPPPLLMAHGEKDNLIPLTWATHTFQNLKVLNVKGEFFTVNAEHEMNEHELQKVMNWINTLIPEK